mmetsp:Transcript_4730/g.8090  ORF Transcript_4730/g.8090 Transcript_4730/m.8090 type:complete len:218 (+) Transcript_4730:259-912(+)
MVLRLLLHDVVYEHERCHGLDHGYGARHYARVVTPACAQLRLHLFAGDSHLLGCDGGRRLERHLDHDRLPVRDAALDATRAIGAGTDVAVLVAIELVVVRAACHHGALEPAAHRESLGGREGHHGGGEVRLELGEHGRAEAFGHVAHHAGHHAAAAVAAHAHLVDRSDHAHGHLLVWAAHDVALHIRHRERLQVHVRGLHVPHAGDEGQNLYSRDGL